VGGLNYVEFQRCARVGLEQARASLSAFTGRDLELGSVDMAFVDLRTVPLLSGDPESVVLASYVSFRGDAEGQLMMLFRPDTAEKVAAFLTPEVFQDLRQEEIPQLLESLLPEVANVVGSSLLNAIADGAGFKLVPTPPIMVRDMAGAVLGSAMTYTGVSDTVYVVHIKFTLSGGKATFEIVFLPKVSSDLDKFLGDRVGQCKT
jgi:chemotaxis protein CheY-P-specific phosphatase CheC